MHNIIIITFFFNNDAMAMTPHCSQNVAIRFAAIGVRHARRSPRSAFAALGSAPLFLKPMLAALYMSRVSCAFTLFLP